MVNRYVMKSEHDLFIDCLPYEWRSGTSDGLFLPIYPPRSMRVSSLFQGLINFCNKYVSSLWLMLSPWIIRNVTLPPLLASLIPHTFRWYHKPTITFLKTATIPTYYGISIAIPRYIAMQLSTILLLWHASSLSYCLHDHVVDIIFVAKPPFIIFIHVSLYSLHMLVHRQRHSYRVIFCSKYWVVIVEL